MDRHMWQEHLLLCSQYFIQHARHYTARLQDPPPAASPSSRSSTDSGVGDQPSSDPGGGWLPQQVVYHGSGGSYPLLRETDICEDTPSITAIEDDPGGGGSGGPLAGLRTYPHPHPHSLHHPHSHPHPHQPMSLHEVSMLKAELQLVTSDRGEVIRGVSDRMMLRDGGSGSGGAGGDPRHPRGSKPQQQPLDTHKALLLTGNAGGGGGVGDLGKRGLTACGSSNSGVLGTTSTMSTPTKTLIGAGVDDHRVYIPQQQQQQQGGAGLVPLSSDATPTTMVLSSSGHDSLSHSGREYERLKANCDWAENELQSLKRQHGETLKKCDQAVREADLYRHKYKLTKDRLDLMQNELHMVKSDHKSLLSEKQRYMLEVEELKKRHEQDQVEIEQLENQQREVMSESGSSEILNTRYDAARDKYRLLKQDYDELRKRYSELGASHNLKESKIELLTEENRRVQKQYEEVLVDLDTAIIERKGLQTQCTAAIMKWHNTIHEKTEMEKEVQKARLERDEYKKSQRQAQADNHKTNKDIGRLRGERDAVVHEYSLVMSERDAVHKEIEQLNDKLTNSQKKRDELDKEKKNLALEVESLRQEIASALHDRDHALKLLNDARQQVGEQLSQDSKFLSDRELAGHGSRDTLERDQLQNSYEQTKKEAAETKELANKEVDALRREIEQVQADLTDALSEAELSKRRRDWAFSERDKIVLERESIKTLCDELRRERDRAVSEQAQALRDLDDLRKQKTEACRELKEVKEKHESLVEKEARRAQLHSVGVHNHSRDSAIDADLQEWETETLELDIGTVGGDDLGFDLCGGKDDPQLPNDSSIFISNIAKTGMAQGKLKVNDQLIRINNIDVTNAEKKVVLQAVKTGGSVINMVVRRRKSSTTRSIQPVHLHLTGSRDLGISIESGLYISRILPGSVAAKEGNLAVGDRILNVNGQSVENLSVCDVLHLVEEGGDYVMLSVLKYAPTPQPSLVSSSASSGQILPESSPEGPASSPKSPRAQLWVTPSPDASKPPHIKSSGSQTDSLDSPQGGRVTATSATSASGSGGDPELDHTLQGTALQHHNNNNTGGKSDQPVLHDRACAKIFRDIYSTAETTVMRGVSVPSRVGRDHHHHQHHNGDLQPSSTNTHMMVMPTAASTEPSTDDRSVDDEAKDVVEEIHAIIKQQQSKPHLKSPGGISPSHSRRQKERENGGTWPKCRPPFEYPVLNGPAMFPSGGTKKDRPPLGALLMNDHPYVSGSGSGGGGSMISPKAHHQPAHISPSGAGSAAGGGTKVPPTPPERSDSFNRGKSIKHSPQSSDSVVKYAAHDQRHMTSTLPSGGVSMATSKSSPYITSSSSGSNSGNSGKPSQPSSMGHLALSPIASMAPPARSTATSQPLDHKSLMLALSGDRDSGTQQQQHRDRMEHVQKSTAAMLLLSGMDFAGGSGGVMSGSSLVEPLSSPSHQQQQVTATQSTSSSCSSPVSCSSPPATATSYLPASMDTSVKSAKLNHQEQVEYIRRPRPNRPLSAPSRGRKERRGLATQQQGGMPQKPNSLPVQPMYSPRPLPASGGQNIGPTQPLLFRPGFNSPTSVKPTHSSGSIGQRSIDGCYPFVRGRTTGVGHAVVWPLPQHPHRGSPSSTLPMTSPTSSIPSSHSSQPLSPRYTPPNGYSTSRSGDIVSDTETDRIIYSLHDNRLSTPSPSPSQQSSSFNQSSQTLSDEYPAYPRVLPWSNSQGGSDHHTSDGGCSTLPRHHRHYPGDHRFPSHTTPSIEKVSDRESPVPNYSFQPNQSHSLPATMRHKRPQVGETRNIHVEKSQGRLGILIDPSSTGGIFVSSVSENSLAAHAGIEVGDQLLEVCGINMRKAPYKLAASVLRQCRDSVTMLVQYNPEKYMEEESSDEGSSSDSSANNTPQTTRTNQGTLRVGSDGSTITPQSLSPQSLSPSHSSKPVPPEGNYMPCEPRFVFLTKTSPQDPLGTRFVGGNSSGIFVDSVAPNSSASGPHGLRCGDQILEFNGTNFRVATAEQAEVEVSKPTDCVTILAQYNIAKYNAVHDKPGDAIYVRALCDHDAEIEGELSFKKDDILFVDNTLYNGMLGVWRAWLVDDEGNKLRSGTIPSKTRLEDELAHKRSLSDTIHDDELKGARRGSASARRSFFRRKKHTRNNSKDSRELNSFSDASINSDSIPYLDDGHTMPFQRVERLDCMIHRPVLILGPLAEPLIDKLTSESPDKYCRCKPERVRATQSSLETGKDKGVFLDYQRRDSHYECIRVDTIKDIIEKNRHAMLNCSPEAIERLHKVQIYPIVVFIRHKSPKQIREVKDTRFLPEKLNNKVAKEVFEQFQEYEQKYKLHFSDIIQGGNLAYMSVNIKNTVDKQQRKTLWIPAGSI